MGELAGRVRRDPGLGAFGGGCCLAPAGRCQSRTVGHPAGVEEDCMSGKHTYLASGVFKVWQEHESERETHTWSVLSSGLG